MFPSVSVRGFVLSTVVAFEPPMTPNNTDKSQGRTCARHQDGDLHSNLSQCVSVATTCNLAEIMTVTWRPGSAVPLPVDTLAVYRLTRRPGAADPVVAPFASDLEAGHVYLVVDDVPLRVGAGLRVVDSGGGQGGGAHSEQIVPPRRGVGSSGGGAEAAAGHGDHGGNAEQREHCDFAT